MDYKDTLNLPKTDFPMKANLAAKEPVAIKEWDEEGLYEKIIDKNKGKTRFVMHDGPPYANGNIHHGHILNKVLKDIVVKFKNMTGYRCEYVPGWDCHGLPIEHQVDKELGKKKENMSKSEIRKECRKYAQRFIEIQKDEFKRLGILGEWERPYKTMDPKYEARTTREFGKIVGNGYVLKKKKPVHWCIECVTALAEAEVEYEDHSSPSIYVAFPVKTDPKKLNIPGGKKDNTFMVIWTTTPWTIPANLAIALNPDFEYSAVDYHGKIYIVASKLLDNFIKDVGFTDHKVVKTMAADDFKGFEFVHPLYKDRISKIVYAGYVTDETGTGCVHTAPGHGQEDYETGLKYGLDIYSPVDGNGNFDKTVGHFSGQNVFKANKPITQKLKEDGFLLAEKSLSHSYPHCWRCKNPVIFRATEQWFISVDHEDLRKKTLKEIDRIKWVPKWGRDRIYGMVETRPDWCISRQRVWGNPLMSLQCKDCEISFVDEDIIEHFADIFEKNTTDIWFEEDISKLLPKKAKCPKCGGGNLEKEYDILDVWFDSGTSHAAVLEDMKLGWPSDIYLEGSDQHRGWFQSSLLESMMTRDKSPYKLCLTHGFIVDGQGKKMSKSLGNFIPPEGIIKKYGAEILRLWVASEDYRYDISLSDTILERMVEAYRRIRNTNRFILGNLYDFDPVKDQVPREKMLEIDKWILDRLQRLVEKIRKAYEEYNFHVLYHELHNFCVVDLSSVYLDILKDRLYVSKAASLERRSAQTALFYLVSAMSKLMAPVFSFTAEEIFKVIPKYEGKEESVHMSEFPSADKNYLDEKLNERWERFLGFRSEISKALEIARNAKLIGHSLDAMVEISAGEKDLKFLESFGDQLKYYLIVSDVSLGKALDGDVYSSQTIPGFSVKVSKAKGLKCERCWNYSKDVGEVKDHPTICVRCADAVR